MKFQKPLIAICLTISLAGCLEAETGARFSDVMRPPPEIQEESAQFLIKNEREFSEWVVETSRKCQEFGCVE